MAKKNNNRKYAAIALGIVGIAGLSLASAATLNVTESSPLVGVSTGNECDNAVNVSYTSAFTGGAFKTSAVTVSGIDADCKGKPISVIVLGQDTTTTPLATVSGNVPSSGTGDLSVVLNISPTIASAGIYQAAVSIS